MVPQGERAEESTVGITHFITENDTGFSGVLKQRYSDFVVHEVTRDGEVCKGTDFPGLLRPIEHERRQPPPAHGQPTADAAHKETPSDSTASPTAVRGPDAVEDGSKDKEAEGKGNDEGGSKDKEGEGKGDGEGGAVDGSSGGGMEEEEEEEDARRAREEEERERKKKEAEEELKKQAKSGAETLLPVVGEEVAAKVEAFMLEGLGVTGKDKRTLTLPTTDKNTRTKVYGLLKQNLSKYLLAVTVDDPASAPPPTASKTETPEAKDAEDGDAKATAGASDNKGDAGGEAPAAEEGNGTEKPSSEKAGENGGGGGEPAEKTAATTKASAGTPAAAKKPDPNGPKCVQLKMKPDWRRVDGGNKRRRGDLGRSGGGGGRGAGGRRWAWPEGRPEFCRFVLYKENSDTMGAVSRICKHLRFSSKVVGYAGTKDKRGVTAQWCTVKRKSIEELRSFNRPLGAFQQGSIVLLGNFSYVAEPLKLGDLSGNRFGVVLRNLTLPSGGENGTGNGAENGAGAGQDASADDASKKEAEDPEAAVVEAGAKLKETVDRRCAWVKERGFINYFGLQRFGSGGAPTSEVGLAMLKEDWAGAVRLIMTPRMGENEATHASKVHYLKNPTDIQGTLNKLPFFMDAEKSMMQALLKGGPNAHIDALKAVPKNLQLMYLHAFQSLLWNLAASERIKLYGRDAAVEGDLVFPRDSPAAAIEDDATLVDPATGAAAVDAAERDGDGEDEGGEGQQPEAKRAKTAGSSLPPVHVVTKEDVEEGTFRVTDVVLPMPGSGVTYPANGVKECYTKALEERGVTEACFSSSTQKAFKLGGAYRRLLQVPKDMQWELKRYDDHTLHLINTDIDDLLDIDDARIAKEDAEKKKKKEEEAAAAAAAAADPSAADPTAADPTAGADGEKQPPSAKKEEGESKATTPDAMDVDGAAPESNGEASRPALRGGGRFHGLCLHFTLPSSSYATMCLREVTQQDTSTIFHTSLNSLSAGQHPAKRGSSAATAGAGRAAAAGAEGGEERDEEKASPPKRAVIKIGSSFK
ncbi:unnamed protein product [Ectocarpus sp. 6 AP-2014]